MVKFDKVNKKWHRRATATQGARLCFAELCLLAAHR